MDVYAVPSPGCFESYLEEINGFRLAPRALESGFRFWEIELGRPPSRFGGARQVVKIHTELVESIDGSAISAALRGLHRLRWEHGVALVSIDFLRFGPARSFVVIPEGGIRIAAYARGACVFVLPLAEAFEEARRQCNLTQREILPRRILEPKWWQGLYAEMLADRPRELPQLEPQFAFH